MQKRIQAGNKGFKRKNILFFSLFNKRINSGKKQKQKNKTKKKQERVNYPRRNDKKDLFILKEFKRERSRKDIKKWVLKSSYLCLHRC